MTREQHHWTSAALRMGVACGLLYCMYAVTTRAVAVWCFRTNTLQGIRQAIRWDPGNPQYHAALARSLQLSMDGAEATEAIQSYEQATRLAPNRAQYWADLGGAYEWAGRWEDARRALERALALFPNSPDINWKLGNFYIRAGQRQEALRALKKTLLGNPQMRRPAFDLVWRATGDVDLILAEMMPPHPDAFLELLGYLIAAQKIEEANVVWSRLLALQLPFEPARAFPYLDALIQHRQNQRLISAWSALAGRNPTRIRPHRPESNFMNNGDFESEILNGGLDWQVRPVEGVTVRVDSLSSLDGTRSLQIRFDGKHNVNYEHVFQFVPVQPDTSYHFLGYLRAEEITTDSRPRFAIQDAYDTSRLDLSTGGVAGTSSWSAQQLAFHTGPETWLLLIRIVRPPSHKFANQIAGTVSVDHLTLTAIR